MKKFLFTLFFLTSSIIHANEKYVVTGVLVNVRESNNPNSVIKDSVSLNDTIYIDTIFNDWAHINMDTINGYINTYYIQKIENEIEKNESKIDFSKFFKWLIYLLAIFFIYKISKIIVSKFFSKKDGVKSKKSSKSNKEKEIKKENIVKKEVFKGKFFEFDKLQNLNNESQIIDFLNTYGEKIGSVKYLGAFADDIKITKKSAVRTSFNYIKVERKEYDSESSGQKYTKTEGTTNIFEMSYDLPDKLDGISDVKNYVILPTVKTFDCSKSEKCSRCNGSGKCSVCDGRGYNRCDSCEGTGKKQVRDGQFANGKPKFKKIACRSCHGSGRNSCYSCDATKKCSRCVGSGNVTCSRCEGIGVFQSYRAYSNKFIPGNIVVHHSEYNDLNSLLPNSKGDVVFDDDLVEWSTKSHLIFDNRKSAILSNQLSKEVIDNLENLILGTETDSNIGRVSAIIESIPIIQIDYNFEGQNFVMYIIGNNNIICYFSIPNKHNFKLSLFSRFLKSFNKTKRQIAFVYIASYIFNADDNIPKEEIELLELFVKHIKISEEKKKLLLSEISRKLNFEDILPKISSIKNDKRALIFAWHCAIQDNGVNQFEIDAFNKLSEYFKLKSDEIELLKNKASKFASLQEKEMLEEYFK
jgi:hypothetical protein